jgi:hypothetical protein
MAEGVRRPIGVTLVGILYFLSGLLTLLVGVGLALVDPSVFNGTPLEGVGQTALFVAGGIFAAIGLISLLIAFGCFKGWGWTWTLGVIFAVIGILVALFSGWSYGWTSGTMFSMVISILIEILILVYLFRPGVKAWFGKA